MMVKKIVIAAVIILVIIGIIAAAGYITAVFMRRHKNDYILDGPGMERNPCDYIDGCSYYYGGGMDGSSEVVELKRLPDGTVLFTYSNCPYAGAEEEIIEKTITSDAVFDELKNICRRTRVLQWGDLEKDELIVLDAPSSSITFTYFGDITYTVHGDDLLPESGIGLFSEIYNYLISLK